MEARRWRKYYTSVPWNANQPNLWVRQLQRPTYTSIQRVSWCCGFAMRPHVMEFAGWEGGADRVRERQRSERECSEKDRGERRRECYWYRCRRAWAPRRTPKCRGPSRPAGRERPRAARGARRRLRARRRWGRGGGPRALGGGARRQEIFQKSINKLYKHV